MDGETVGLLSPYRVLDLTDEKGLFCAKVLADLGADVIKVEPPSGSTARKIAPFHKNVPHFEKSLLWFADNTNKRGITLNLECADGQEIFRRLVAAADVVVESFPPGYMKYLGLGYDDLCRIKSDIILTSIKPFGQDGYCNFQTSDLTCWSMRGFAYITGDPGSSSGTDRLPLGLFEQRSRSVGGYYDCPLLSPCFYRGTIARTLSKNHLAT